MASECEARFRTPPLRRRHPRLQLLIPVVYDLQLNRGCPSRDYAGSVLPSTDTMIPVPPSTGYTYTSSCPDWPDTE